MLTVSNEPIFLVADYVVFMLVILGSLFIGAYYACANKTTDEYFTGSRKLKIFPVGVSILVTFLSPITILGKPAEMFYYGMEYWFTFIGSAIGTGLVCFLFVPLLHPLRITSINEYIFMRYRTKLLVYLCCGLQLTNFTIVGGVVLFGPATMMESFAGVTMWQSMLATALIATVYTSIGGFKAVIWSDVFQSVGILVGMLAVVILGCMQVGSLKEVFEVYQSQGRTHVRTDVALTVRSTVWCYAVGGALGSMAMLGVSQASVQRYCSMPTLRSAQKALLIVLPGHMILSTLACLSGIVAFAYYTQLGCDPFRAGLMQNTNQIIPQFIKDVLRFPALPGLFAACVFCGTVSTLSSTYNCFSALLWNDLLRDLLEKYHLQENRKSLITKCITLIAGLTSTAAGFLMSEMGGTLIQMIVVVTGVLQTPLCAIIFMGALSTRSSWKSVTLTAACSFALLMYISVGGVLYGSNKEALPTVTHNCSALLNPADSQMWNESSLIRDWSTQQHGCTTNAFSHPDQDGLGTEYPHQHALETPATFVVFRISHLWYFPIGFIFSTVLGFILAYTPGLGESELVDEKLVFPFVRRWMKKEGYEQYEKEEGENGVYIKPGEEKVKIDLENNTVIV